MSTHHTDIGQEPQPSGEGPGSIHTQDTVQKQSVAPTFPQPPLPKSNRRFVWIAATIALVLILSMGVVLAQLAQRPGPQRTPTPTPKATVVPTTPPSDTTPTPAPGVILGPQACPAAVKDPAHWVAIVDTQSGTTQVENVTCANMLGNPSLQAQVTVRHSGADGVLDVYVYNNITDSKPEQIFKLEGLIRGVARISGYNTVMTGEADVHSSVNQNIASRPLVVDLFREFEWNDGEGTFVQVAFPGIFPDLTRYQAEADQALINQGQETWKNDPAQVAQKLAVKFFDWKRTLTATVTSGGGAQDVYATVKVEEAPVTGMRSGPSASVTLSRLEGNTHNMWVAIAVEDGLGALTNIEARSLIASPVKLEGKGGAFEGVIGMAYILDHLYTTVGRALVTDHGMRESPYSISVSYDTSFKSGPQEGIVEVQMTSPVEADPYSAVMVKVLLAPEPGVALGPVSCPMVVQQRGFWESILGIDPNAGGIGTVSCANLKGDPSLQALVPVFYNDGKPGGIHVYDHITDAHPVQIFSLQVDSAMISGCSTIMTADIDRNSSINKGKSRDQLTMDLFREFQWSEGARTFVQVAFPGVFPDLTRYQAEVDQALVNQGQDTWKNDAAKVAQTMAVKLLKWSPNTQTTVLSGGGPKDVDAVVQVRSTSPGHPAIKVTLSRLEGNTANMWVVIGVQTDGMSITAPQNRDRLTSPVTVTGTGSAFEAQVGIVYVFDHLYTDIGHAEARGAQGMGPTTFTTKVTYNASFHGVQEGVVALYSYSAADSSIAGVVILKELISG